MKLRFNNSRPHFCMPKYPFFPSLPGFFNPPPFSFLPEMFQRFFSARQTPLPERQELSSGHTGILEDCITTIRTDIFQLERRIKLINADILTVCHCIKNKQPSFVPPNSVRLPEISQTEAVSSPFKGSPKKSAGNGHPFHCFVPIVHQTRPRD